ncbi:glucans biosynthesis protein [Tranquillimonas rosea]|uniref:Glucans biosynthesis protein n=1 Tax=Tranquillimonas rosea TaxID=641238 RepID=A0A1H9WQX9_9RHOB|nr:glucans biosynthesis protein [Tranquillimonas rosea]
MRTRFAVTEISPSRRAFLGAALSTGAFYLLPEAARAQAETPMEMAGEAHPFSFDRLIEDARTLSTHQFIPMKPREPDILERIDYDRHNQIQYRENATLWSANDTAPPVRFFFPGRYFKEPVHIYAVSDGMAREIPFSPDLFRFPEDHPARQLSDTRGFAGFRVMDQEMDADWLAFLGASYFRTAGYSGQFGLSARGLALDTAVPGGPEEFPRFTRFWLEPGEGSDLVSYALLESPRATGAYRIASRREDGVIQDIEAKVFLRGDVERLGVAPLTSMFWFGKHNDDVAPDWRPEVHDSDGLEVHTGNGERIWRPLNNPPRIMTNAFGVSGARGFGLMQRERDFDQYLDDGVFYEKRASAWVEPAEDWGDGEVMLIELPTDDEIHDNIVAFWRPDKPATAGSEHDIRYRLHWVRDNPVPPVAARFLATRIGAGGIPGQPRPEGVVKIVCDFENRGLEDLARDDGVKVNVEASRGETVNTAAYPVVDADYWRAMFDLDFSEIPEDDDAPIDLRMFVSHENDAKTETWIMQLFPSQLRRLLESRA